MVPSNRVIATTACVTGLPVAAASVSLLGTTVRTSPQAPPLFSQSQPKPRPEPKRPVSAPECEDNLRKFRVGARTMGTEHLASAEALEAMLEKMRIDLHEVPPGSVA